jgi:hypothetical protein
MRCGGHYAQMPVNANRRRLMLVISGEQIDDFVHDAFACSGLGIAVQARPGLVATQLESLPIGQITDPIISQLGNVGVNGKANGV